MLRVAGATELVVMSMEVRKLYGRMYPASGARSLRHTAELLGRDERGRVRTTSRRARERRKEGEKEREREKI